MSQQHSILDFWMNLEWSYALQHNSIFATDGRLKNIINHDVDFVRFSFVNQSMKQPSFLATMICSEPLGMMLASDT
jgi:hypothetical protein